MNLAANRPKTATGKILKREIAVPASEGETGR